MILYLYVFSVWHNDLTCNFDVQWPTPDSHKKVQQFLGFVNFYRRFVRGFSAIAAPLHALTSTQVPFRWSPEAEKVFQNLKHRFTTAPILTLPDPQRQFVVEVDASNEGVGAVLSQQAERDGKMHPCDFLSSFSKMVKFIALPKLPAAKETAETITNTLFRVHGFPIETLCQTGGPSLCPGSGGSSADSSEPKPA